MLAVNKYKDVLLAEFYLDSDDVTVRRKKDGWRSVYKAHDAVQGFKLCSFGYTGVHIPRTRSTVSMHHLVTLLRGIQIPDDCVIDHLNGDSEDNSRDNIRVTTQALNCKNQVKSKDNTSGYTGISWNAKANCYIVRKTLQGVRVYGGSAKSLADAVVLLDTLNERAYQDGYTTRHGK